jgi:molybdate transport system regulatory protein
MKISARNVLAGTVLRVERGSVNAEVSLALKGGESMVAIITNASVDLLGLTAGRSAFAIVKASEVMIGKGFDRAKLSARNVLAGQIATVKDGAVNSEILVRLPSGIEIVASITKASAHNLGLVTGDRVSAVIKASNVMIGIE